MTKEVRCRFVQTRCLMKARRFSDGEASLGTVVCPAVITTKKQQLAKGWIVPKGQSFEKIAKYPELIEVLKGMGYDHVPDFRGRFRKK